MSGDMRQTSREDMRIITENCNCSIYTMAAVAGCLLFCVGIIIYALLGA